MKKYLIACIAATVATPAIADFSANITLDRVSYEEKTENSYYYNDYSSSHTDREDYYITSLNGKFYLDAVSTDSVPLREAGFLSKNTVFEVNNLRRKVVDRTRDCYSYCYEGNIDKESWQEFSGHTVINNFVLGGKFTQAGKYADIYSINAGYYITDSSRINIEIGKVQLTHNWPGSDEKITRAIDYRHVFSFGEQAASIEVNYETYGYGEWDSGVEANYYFTPLISIALEGVRTKDHDENDTTTDFLLSGHYYPIETIGFSLGFGKIDHFNERTKKSNALALGLAFNF